MLNERLRHPIRVEEADLYQLDETRRTIALDALVGGHDLPLVVVGDAIVCSGGLDVDSITAALAGM